MLSTAKVLVASISISLLFSALSASAKEGFYKKEQVNADFSFSALERASLFVEENREGQWKHGGNAFYVSKNGYMITNQHIAFNCVSDNRAYFQRRYKSKQEIFDKGFIAPEGDEVICRSIRVSDDPKSGKRKLVAIVAFPPVETINKLADFAVLKVIEDKPTNWLTLQARSDIAVGEDVYGVSYPYITDRKETSKLVQDGAYEDVRPGDYRVTLGKVLPFKDGYYDPEYKDHFYYTDLDGGQGSSGSALLDSHGALAALILGSGEGASSIITNCIPKFEYCGGTVRYLRSGFIYSKLKEFAPGVLERF